MGHRIYSLGMGKNTGLLGVEFDSQDDNDEFVLSNITMPPMQLNTEAVCFKGDETKKEEFLKIIYNITESLFKANGQRRKYIKEEQELIESHLKKSKKDSNKKLDLSINCIELISNVDGLLSNIKSSLDTYVKVLNLFFGLTLHGWHKKKNISGVEVLNQLKNNPSNKYKDHLKGLIEFIEKNQKWITHLVDLRDRSHHKGGLKNISQIIYRQKTDEVLPPQITHEDSKTEPLKEFLNRTIIDFNLYLHTLLMLSLQAKVHFMVLTKKVNGNGKAEYGWGIPK